VGNLYNVKHIWCYDSLADRQKARDIVWDKQQIQWSEIVSSTLPLGPILQNSPSAEKFTDNFHLSITDHGASKYNLTVGDTSLVF
jgi:hypothetical protein